MIYKENQAAAQLLSEAAESSKALAPVEIPSAAELEVDVDRAVRDFRLAATPSATWNAYARALRYLCAWAQVRLGQPLQMPTPVHVVKLFVVDHFGQPTRSPDGGLTIRPALPEAADRALVAAGYKTEEGRHKISTIDHRLAVLSWAHREKKLPSPCQDPAVRQLLSDCRKLARELREGPKSKTAATLDSLDAMLATCDDSLDGLRDRALLLFGWTSGGRRRSEIARAQVEDIEWLGDAEGIFRMNRSKTGDDIGKPIRNEAAIALRVWLGRTGIISGPLFRRLWGSKLGGALSPHAIAEIVKRRAAAAGLSGDFAGHSLRRGFVTEAGLNDTPIAQTMALTGHREVKSVVRYTDAGQALTSKAADLLSIGRARRGEGKP